MAKRKELMTFQFGNVAARAAILIYFERYLGEFGYYMFVLQKNNPLAEG